MTDRLLEIQKEEQELLARLLALSRERETILSETVRSIETEAEGEQAIKSARLAFGRNVVTGDNNSLPDIPRMADDTITVPVPQSPVEREVSATLETVNVVTTPQPVVKPKKPRNRTSKQIYRDKIHYAVRLIFEKDYTQKDAIIEAKLKPQNKPLSRGYGAKCMIEARLKFGKYEREDEDVAADFIYNNKNR